MDLLDEFLAEEDPYEEEPEDEEDGADIET